ncbi:Suppressor of Sensor Kinase (SLN1) [Actinomortierella wolfii]|nr:Suppressor of Sensor Kinase (SLN1) [Actinomortierella wolfii]
MDRYRTNIRVQEGEDQDAISQPAVSPHTTSEAGTTTLHHQRWSHMSSLATTVHESSSNVSGSSFFQDNVTPVVPPKRGVRFMFPEDDDEDDDDDDDDGDDEDDDDNDDDNDNDNDDDGNINNDGHTPSDDVDLGGDIEVEAEAVKLQLLKEEEADAENTRLVESTLRTTTPLNEDMSVDHVPGINGDIPVGDIGQPIDNSDEGVLELNRDRIDWQTMLQSVLTGEVLNKEKSRIQEEMYEVDKDDRLVLRPNAIQQIWLGLRASLRDRPTSDEKRLVDEARKSVDGFLQEVMNFRVKDDIPQTPLEQVMDVLQKIDIVENLYRSLSDLKANKPLYEDPVFQARLDALNSFASIHKMIHIQLKILRNWTGSETLDITVQAKDKDGAGGGGVNNPEELSFVDRLLQTNGLQHTFEKSNLRVLNKVLKQIKSGITTNASIFREMNLTLPMDELQLLIRFPTTLMEECLRLRLEYSSRVTDPVPAIVDQLLEDYNMTLDLAGNIRGEYSELVEVEEGWDLGIHIGSEFEALLKKSLHFYFKLFSWKVDMWGNSKKLSESVLEMAWQDLSKIGQKIDGLGLDTAEQLCFLTSKATTFLYRNLQDQTKEKPMRSQPAGEITKFYGKILENVRLRATKLMRLSKNLMRSFENAAEYLLDRKRLENLNNLMTQLAASGHVMIFTNTVEYQGMYIIADPHVAERPEMVPYILQSCFEPELERKVQEKDGKQVEVVTDHYVGYVIVISPRDRFVWPGAMIHLEGVHGLELDLKPGRVRLVAESSRNLSDCKARFMEVAEPYGVDVITVSRANVASLNKELNRTKKSLYMLADTILQCVVALREVTANVPNCQDLIQPFFRFASDYGKLTLGYMDGLVQKNLNLRLIRLSIDWVTFICDDCDQSDRKTFRWAMSALEFSMNMTKGSNILVLSESEFNKLRTKIAGCMTVLISHFDIHGARSQSEALRVENGRFKDQAALAEEISKLLKYASQHERAQPSDEFAAHRQDMIERLRQMEIQRNELAIESRTVGKVLDDQKPEDRSLAILAALTDTVATRWQMAKYIGSGTFGTVYLGINSDSGELIAVKEIRFQDASMSLVKSIRDEMKVMKMLNHPNIVRYDNIEVHRDKVYIFMEYCQGGSLANLLEHGRIGDEKVVKFYTLQMLKGLAYLHDMNVVHRDVKPDNILLDHMGNIKFVDFGAAKILAKNQRTRTRGGAASVNVGAGSLNGTPMYMAPEVIKGGEKGRKGSMDIWSLGCCVLEMVTGRRPWAHLDNEWAVMYHVATQHPPLPDPSQLSKRGLAFLKATFIRSPLERPTAVELLQHPWLRGVDASQRTSIEDPIPTTEGYEEGDVDDDDQIEGTDNVDDLHAPSQLGEALGTMGGFGNSDALSNMGTSWQNDTDSAAQPIESATVEHMTSIAATSTGREELSTLSTAHPVGTKIKDDDTTEALTRTRSPFSIVGHEDAVADQNREYRSQMMFSASPHGVDQDQQHRMPRFGLIGAQSSAMNTMTSSGGWSTSSPQGSSCDSMASDTISEVGSEVGMMLSALREREETSRQASMVTSPNATGEDAHTSPSLSRLQSGTHVSTRQLPSSSSSTHHHSAVESPTIVSPVPVTATGSAVPGEGPAPSSTAPALGMSPAGSAWSERTEFLRAVGLDVCQPSSSSSSATPSTKATAANTGTVTPALAAVSEEATTTDPEGHETQEQGDQA